MNKLIYLDNAATTPVAPQVMEVMMESMQKVYGNSSSIHQLGRQAKAEVEKVRKEIASILNAHPSEIIFTSGGTESNNLALRSVVKYLGLKNFISSKIEHHSVETTLLDLQKSDGIHLSYVNLDSFGNVDLNHLEKLLIENPKSMVSLMHGNNEIGNVLPLQQVADLCKKHGAFFHSDTVQTIGHLKVDLNQINLDFLSFSAHKIHGPKGVGFLYKNKNTKVTSLFTGGLQERGFRPGTENVSAIVGMGKAIELAYSNLEKNEAHIKSIKQHFKTGLEQIIPGVKFNGNLASSLNSVLNVQFPVNQSADMLLFNLDMKGLAVSGGSACSSGSNKGSHVLSELGIDAQKSNIRFSFSRFTTTQEIDQAIQILKSAFG